MSDRIDKMTLRDIQELLANPAEKNHIELLCLNFLSCANKEADGNHALVSFLNRLCHEYNELQKGSKDKDKSNISEADKGVADSLNPKIYHSCLYDVFNWFLPFVDTYYKIILHTNLCILSDDESDKSFHSLHFCKSLENATTFANKCMRTVFKDSELNCLDDTFRFRLCEALYDMGFWNLRERKYSPAISCFRNCSYALNDLRDNVDKLDLYFNCIVRLANCYEYMDRPDPMEALKWMLNLPQEGNDDFLWMESINKNAEAIKTTIISYYANRQRTNTIENTIKIVESVCGFLCANSEEKKCMRVFELSSQNNELNTTIKLYIHVLAHCVSEYAAKTRTEPNKIIYPACSVLQLVSRFLLDWLVDSCREQTLVSCQATVRAENDACPEAISLLLVRYHYLQKQISEASDEKVREKYQTESNELAFYLFYFSEQELRFNYKDEKLESIFNKYGDIFKKSAEDALDNPIPDYDPLFHYYVIQFKYLLKRKAEELLQADAKLNYLDIDLAYRKMCTYKEICSEHIFPGLLAECARLEKLYSVFQKLRWLTAKKSLPETFNELMRLHSYYLEDGLKDKGTNDRELEGDGIFEDGASGQFGVEVNDLNDYSQLIEDEFSEIMRRNKILILAPVREAPSCSSEYDEIKPLLELSIPNKNTILESNPLIDSYGPVTSKRDANRITLKIKNNGDLYSNLKWAVYVDRANVINNTGIGITYLYTKGENSVQDEYRKAIPLFMENAEPKQLLSIVERIKNKYLKKSNSALFQELCSCHDDKYGSDCCTYCFTYEKAKIVRNRDSLLNCINDLLVFLEYDFTFSSKLPVCNGDTILITNVNTESHKYFSILVFENSFPDIHQHLCSLCENFCTEDHTGQEGHSVPRVSPTDEADLANQFPHTCAIYTDRPENVHRCVAELENRLIDYDESTENHQLMIDRINNIRQKCLKGTCVLSSSSNRDECLVLNSINEWKLSSV